MTKIIKIYVDIHKYGTCELDVKMRTDDDCYYLGDNIDVAHCHYSQISRVYEELTYLRNSFGNRFVRGNHELDTIDAPDFIVVGDTVLCHGDQIFWPDDKVRSWRHQSPGLGTVGRLLTEGTYDFLRYLTPKPMLNKDQVSRAVRLASKYGKRRIVCAHRHPARICVYKIQDIELVVLPRGMTEIEVEV